MRARALIEQAHSFARDFSATELNDLAAFTCERLYGQRDFERLSLPRFNLLLSALCTELRDRNR